MWHKAIGIEHPMKLKLTRKDLLGLLVNKFTTRGTNDD